MTQSMSRAARRCLLAGALAAIAVNAAHATNREFDEEFDDRNKAWNEVAAQIPPAPMDANLIEFFENAGGTYRFSIDTNAISIGADGVVRYTLVGQSRAGARSVSYEGIRCATREIKLYAFGHSDGTWGRSQRDSWEPIARNAQSLHQVSLYNDYLCTNGLVGGSIKDMIARLKEKRPSSIRSW